MNTPKRFERMSGYQQSFIDIQSNPPLTPAEPEPPASKTAPSSLEETQEVSLSGEISTYDGKKIYSYHPKVCETIKMNDTNKATSAKRSVGIDIGTGFISCAEQEGGSKKFRKVRDAFFKLDRKSVV